MIIERILILAIVLQHAEPQGEAIFQPSASTDWKFESTGTMSKAARAIVKKVLSIEQAEGVGARVRRSVGRQEVHVGLFFFKFMFGIRGNPLSRFSPAPPIH